MAPKTLINVNEIFYSIQGESSLQGWPCVFVRLTGCNLRCAYCDTTYAYQEGRQMHVEEVVDAVQHYACGLVEITGGEPMMQPEAAELARWLLELDFRVMMETNGSIDLSPLPKEVIKIVDIKTPGSGEGKSFLKKNLKCLDDKDEVKFVITSRADFEWAAKKVKELKIAGLCAVNISPAAGKVSFNDAAQWILESGLPLRLNLQLHRVIWGEVRGV